MQNDDKDDGYSEEEEDESCLRSVFRHFELDESMISHVPGNSMNGALMTIHQLAECADTVHVPARQSAARRILEALQFAVTSVEAYSEQEDVEKVFGYIKKLSEDSDTVVRCNLLSALPKVASFCAEYDSPLVSLKELIETDILPLVLKAIADEDRNCNLRVRREGYAVLKYLFNNNLVTQKIVEDKISDLCSSFLFHPNDIINLITAGNEETARVVLVRVIVVCRINIFISQPALMSVNLLTFGETKSRNRMAPVVGEAMTEKLLLPKISELCTCHQPKVREACVHYLIDLACHVNSLVTENIIVPLFIKLSEDEAYCVRKACAETIVTLSCLCLMETRKTVLTNAFLYLLTYCDVPVPSVAFKQLGPFMTTFAQPPLIALGSNRNGDYLLIHCQSGSTFELMSRRLLFQFFEQPEHNSFSMFMLPMKTLDSDMNQMSDASGGEQTNTETDMNGGILPYSMNDVNETEDNADETNEQSSLVKDDDGYIEDGADFVKSNPLINLEWITDEDDCNPPANTDVDCGDQFQHESKEVEIGDEELMNQPDLIQSCLKSPEVTHRNKRNHLSKRSVRKNRDLRDNIIDLECGLSVFLPKCIRAADTRNQRKIDERFNSFQFWREPIPALDECDLPSKERTENQDRGFIVSYRENEKCDGYKDSFYLRFEKARIRAHDVKRMNVTRKQSVVPQALLDAFNDMVWTVTFDVKMHCAYTFPAVVLTLGASNWYLVKDTYTKLATDSERQLRQMVASSIHEIASILGPELATEDLIPIYNSLINDIEDIRITALNHLSCFVKLLKPHGRCQFLPHLMEYMMTDYVWNWRFRQQLCEQLVEMMDFFVPTDCWKYISPVALSLLMDRVSAVRLQALSLVTHLIRVVSVDLSILRGLLAELAEQFAHSTQWTRRQSFAFLCSALLRTPVLPDDMFARDVLPHLLDLSWDSIPNVRIAVARTLSCDVFANPFFSNSFSPHYDVLSTILKKLLKDKDRDVRYYASLSTSPLTKFESPVG